MDKMVQAIARAPDEQARRAILKQNVDLYPALMDPPEYPDALILSSDPKPNYSNVSSDYLLTTFSISCLGRRTRRLLRVVYAYEYEIGSDGEFVFRSLTYFFEMAETDWKSASHNWKKVPVDLLINSVDIIIDDMMFEQERRNNMT